MKKRFHEKIMSNSDYYWVYLFLLPLILCFVPARSWGAISFANFTTYNSDYGFVESVINDFNGDGKLDIVYTNGVSHSISVLLGNGDGSFQPAVDYDAGLFPFSLTAGDFNNDGKLDIANTNQKDALTILIGNGDGSFMPAVTTGADDDGRRAIATADFNNDGNLDIVTSKHGSLRYADKTLTLFWGNGDGTFLAPEYLNSNVWGTSIELGDFNNDGNIDFAVGHPFSSRIAIYLSNGDGTFQPNKDNPGVIATIFNKGFAVKDFNGDGILDIVTTGWSDFGNILLGNGDGTFQRSFFYGLSSDMRHSIAASDFDCDGKNDFATVSFSFTSSPNSYFSIFAGNGDGTFQASVDYGQDIIRNNYARLAAIEEDDLNGDGKIDLLIKRPYSEKIEIHLNTGSGCGPTAPSDLISIINDMLANGAISGPGAHGVGNALIAKLEAAQAALNLDPPDYALAISDLNAFINQILAQSGKKISAEAADQLIGYAQALIDQYSAML